MSEIFTAEKLAEIKNYEAQMSDYFSHYSSKLREWYMNGGDKSEEYQLQYSKLTEEYERYLKYIQRLRCLMNPNVVQPQQNLGLFQISNAAQSALNNNPEVSVTNHPSASAAADYTRYYQDMINYFDKLLASIPQSELDDASSDEESRDEHIKKTSVATTPNTTSQCKVLAEKIVHSIESEVPIVLDPCSDPNAIMKQYFDRYVETGQWDWASWNNYLSWIARTYPQWYDIFVNLSRQMGIDWTDMYEKWTNCVGGSSKNNVSFHASGNIDRIVTQELANKISFQNNDSNYTNETPKTFDDNYDQIDWNYCATCEQHFGSERAFSLHLRAVKHTLKTLQANEVITNPSLGSKEETWETKHHEWLKSQYAANNRNNELLIPGSFYCELCEVHFPSHKALGSHINGRRHRENVSIFERTGDRSLLKGKRPAQIKVTAKIQTFLDVCIQPLIGVNYLAEYQFTDMDDCLYYCDLCSHWLSRKIVVKHLCSILHRKNYLKTHYSHLYRIVERDSSDIPIQTSRLDVYARKIEDFEGRKRLTIKQESVAYFRNYFEYDKDGEENNDESELKEKNIEENQSDDYFDRYEDSISKNQIESLENPISPASTISSDLEEGEVRDESSDDNCSNNDDNQSDCEVISNESDETFLKSHQRLIAAIERHKQENSKNLNSELDSFETNSKDKDISSSENSELTDEQLESYIKNLEDSGLLSIKSPSVGSKRLSNSKTKYVHQFNSEADWVLDKLSQLQIKREKEMRDTVADISATARMHAFQTSQSLKSAQLYQGIDVNEQTRNMVKSGAYNSCFIMPIDPRQKAKEWSSGSLILPALNQPVGPTISKEKADSIVLPICKTIDSSRLTPSVALSKSAFSVILSAIDALKSSGQLPDTLKPASTKETETASTVTSVVNTQKLDELPTKRIRLEVPTTSSISVTCSANKPEISQPVAAIATSSFEGCTSTISTISSDLASLLSFSKTAISNVSTCISSNSTFVPPANTVISKISPINIIEMKSEAVNSVKISEFQPVKSSNQEEIFDAYTLFSRRCEQKKQAKLQKLAQTSRYFKPLGKSSGNQDSSSQSNTGKKLSAIADFLGLNEPPTVRPKCLPSDNQKTVTSHAAITTTPSYPSFSSTNNVRFTNPTEPGISFVSPTVGQAVYTNPFTSLNISPLTYGAPTDVSYSSDTLNMHLKTAGFTIGEVPVAPNAFSFSPVFPIASSQCSVWPVYVNLPGIPVSTSVPNISCNGTTVPVTSWTPLNHLPVNTPFIP